MYVYVCGEENNFLTCCSIICFLSGDHWIYVHLLLMVYWFLCLYIVLHKDWWVLVGWSSCRWRGKEGVTWKCREGVIMDGRFLGWCQIFY